MADMKEAMREKATGTTWPDMSVVELLDFHHRHSPVCQQILPTSLLAATAEPVAGFLFSFDSY